MRKHTALDQLAAAILTDGYQFEPYHQTDGDPMVAVMTAYDPQRTTNYIDLMPKVSCALTTITTEHDETDKIAKLVRWCGETFIALLEFEFAQISAE